MFWKYFQVNNKKNIMNETYGLQLKIIKENSLKCIYW